MTENPNFLKVKDACNILHSVSKNILCNVNKLGAISWHKFGTEWLHKNCYDGKHACVASQKII